MLLLSCYLCTTVLETHVVKVMAYTMLLSLVKLVSMMRFNCKATSANDTDYSCHIIAIEFV